MSNSHESNCYGITDPYNKTLFVEQLAGEFRRDEIVRHFSAFGYVKNVRICAQVESVSKALESDFHTIAGRIVQITSAYDDRSQDETTFLDLNDDCIHGILSTICLSALDLCSVAETSSRLKQIAGRIFRRKYTICDLRSLANREVNPAQRILRNFGTMISDLKMNLWISEDSGRRIFDSVARYCSNTLESLCIDNCLINDNFPAKLRPNFNNLKKVRISGCRIECVSKELFANCGSLVELELRGKDVGSIIKKTFPKLQKFKYDFAVGIDFDSFILRHKNLTSITILRYSKMTSLLPLIADNCKRLEELEINICGIGTFDLSNLGHLRKLNIHCFDRDVLEAVRGWNNLQFLENLTLRWPNVDPELIQTLSQLKRLQVLRLSDCLRLENFHGIGDLDFVLLIKRLSNLKRLSVKGFGFEMDLKTYLQIVDVVRARPDKSTLAFEFNGFRRRPASPLFT